MPQKQQKPCILVAEDDASIRVIVNRALVEAGFDVRATPSVDALERWVEAGEGDVVVSDVYLGEDSIFDRIKSLKHARPTLPFILMSGQNSILTAAASADHGAFDYLPKPFDIGDMVELVKRAANTRPMAGSQPKLSKEDDLGLSFLGRSAAMQKVYREVTRVMNTRLPVFLKGEIGSGRYLTALSIHKLGNRRSGKFSTSLDNLEGVSTLFIPNILNLTARAQDEVRRLLYDADSPRVICAADPSATGDAFGQVQGDLLLRLQAITISLPSLRERKSDIEEIAMACLGRAAELGMPKQGFHPKALELLLKHDWPGNVQELENIVFRLCAFCPDTVISAQDVMAELVASDTTALNPTDVGFEATISKEIATQIWPKFLAFEGGEESLIHKDTMDVMEREILRLALDFTGQNKLKAAKLLGMNRNTLRARLEALDII